ncbi:MULTISPECIES: long-chain fatty acid--CoA ligase [Pseudonocardia]|uniref:Long-chain-fatty-acid--CoA ligase n=2 Tax=Pseudonocardia TaxID=1847 RepID=A0A1Y2MI15_PSEAH|nr:MULTISPECIES: long-chain fatty acid--CoA ligase [Pseudonocardia]OSY34925.1 Long-chain-fatty-acid--CoA ligase [Pseudonocardia autotrophica]TDN76988.1 fatty-acyl-CoA synthase [Pseudonocardia autotrophica]BBG00992.1 long-chain-fatty-acid--CoA ligase [Pseudonocardia autotrophica]GEC29133.1 long-chain-fatty-acid--CoA ligase [Pseudonocardia saturnea]
MLGLMQDRPLTLPHVFHRAEQYFGHKELITATPAGTTETTTIADWAVRVRRLAAVLDTLGISPDGRVGTFCWNTTRHLELYLAVPCTGRVLHTLNLRLFPDQLVYVANHAGDEVVFVERSLLGLFWQHIDRLETVRHVVVIDDGAGPEIPDDPRVSDYEELLAAAEPVTGRFVVEDENTAAAMCYTSGTTGNPKGVVYSHRSTLLHSLATLFADGLGLCERDVVLPVVPMFHANAWGLPYGCLLAGSSLVLPGPGMTPDAILSLIAEHRVTLAAGVPTIWMGLLPKLSEYDVSSLRTVLCGGSAVPKSLSEGFREAIGLPVLQGWGMTETSPLAALGVLRAEHDGLSDDGKADVRAQQGPAVPLVELRIADPETGEEQPWDGVATGEVQAAGPWIAKEYYGGEGGGGQFTDDGWLRTGDVAVVDRLGYVKLVDRTKDLVKSGGEWISSVDLENEIMAHPKVAEAAVIAVAHEKWVERPLACVVVKGGEQLTADELIEFLAGRVAKWWLPDAVEFIDEVPKTSVGKFSKKTLREKFGGYQVTAPDAR